MHVLEPREPQRTARRDGAKRGSGRGRGFARDLKRVEQAMTLIELVDRGVYPDELGLADALRAAKMQLGLAVAYLAKGKEAGAESAA